MSVVHDLDGLSTNARLVYFAAISISWEMQADDVPEWRLHDATGLNVDDLYAAVAELDEVVIGWWCGPGRISIGVVSDLLRKSIGPAGRPSAAAWSDLRERVIGYHGERCAYCHNADGQIALDHIVSIREGGSNHFHNLLPACKPCNSAKGGKSWLDWIKAWKGWAL